MRSLAKHLIGSEMRRNNSSEARGSAAFHVSEKLRPHLATLIGNEGFRALLSRALALATTEVPWLRAVHVRTDGSLEGVETIRAQLDPIAFLEGRIVLLAQLLGLLVAFIGPALTSRVVGDIWPQISLKNMDFGDGAKNETAE